MSFVAVIFFQECDLVQLKELSLFYKTVISFSTYTLELTVLFLKCLWIFKLKQTGIIRNNLEIKRAKITSCIYNKINTSFPPLNKKKC